MPKEVAKGKYSARRADDMPYHVPVGFSVRGILLLLCRIQL